MSSDKRADRADATDRIVEAALALIVEQGLGGVTMTEIAERAGVARQTLYNHFPDVDQIVVAAFEQHSNGAFEHLVALLDVASSPEEKIELLARHTVVSAAHGHEVPAIRAALSAEARDQLDRHRGEFRTVIASVISEGVDDGSFDPRLRVSTYATIVEAILLAGATLAGEGGDATDAAATATTAIVRVLRPS